MLGVTGALVVTAALWLLPLKLHQATTSALSDKSKLYVSVSAQTISMWGGTHYQKYGVVGF